jgi:hypothetical protein
MRTLDSLITEHGTEVLDYLDRQVTVPVTDEPQMQGDVSILPVTTREATTPIPKAGVAVVRGESGGNTHSLHGSPSAFFDPAPASGRSLVLGTLTVPESSEAYMAHPEHGFMGIAPGTYRIGRQREQADEIAYVVD